jgi:putative redox protein
MTADEPASVAGTDAGPYPYGLLSAALSACTSITLKACAGFKKLHLRSATVTVTHGKLHADDCADCASTEGKVDEFQRVISLDRDFTDAGRQHLLDIADRCPVHETLHAQARVRARLADRP